MFDEDTETTNQDSQTFNINGVEYTQDQLNDLVALGNKATEIEKNHGDLDNLVSDWGRTKTEVGELRKIKEEQELKQRAEQSTNSNQLTPEQRELALREAARIGFVTEQNFGDKVREEIETESLINDTQDLTEELSDMGIEVDPKVILRYMDAAEIDNPLDAVQELYGDKIKEWQAAEIEKNKPDSWLTQSGGNAGATRSPEAPKITDDNLMDLFREAIGGE